MSFMISTDIPNLNEEENPYSAIAIETFVNTFLKDEKKPFIKL